jgi:hypothetical protein
MLLTGMLSSVVSGVLFRATLHGELFTGNTLKISK